jgi:hypothetical protein
MQSELSRLAWQAVIYSLEGSAARARPVVSLRATCMNLRRSAVASWPNHENRASAYTHGRFPDRKIEDTLQSDLTPRN